MKFGLEQLVDFDHISDEDLNGIVENLVVSFPSAAQKFLKGDLTLSPPIIYSNFELFIYIYFYIT